VVPARQVGGLVCGVRWLGGALIEWGREGGREGEKGGVKGLSAGLMSGLLLPSALGSTWLAALPISKRNKEPHCWLDGTQLVYTTNVELLQRFY